LAISTPGDIILDVVRAADPAAVETARARLASFSGKAADAAFRVSDEPRAEARKAAGTPETFARFEAMVLQTFIQSMLPKENEAVYGQGTAGEMWQSLLAERLGEVMAERGGIGIADRILRDHYIAGEEKVPLQGVSADPDQPQLDSQRMLSLALVQEIQRKTAQSLSEDRAASAVINSR